MKETAKPGTLQINTSYNQITHSYKAALNTKQQRLQSSNDHLAVDPAETFFDDDKNDPK
jgi:hypothetical protein